LSISSSTVLAPEAKLCQGKFINSEQQFEKLQASFWALLDDGQLDILSLGKKNLQFGACSNGVWT